ncbi:hypothetical protein ACTXLK_11800 [Psychrobacter faecalis]
MMNPLPQTLLAQHGLSVMQASSWLPLCISAVVSMGAGCSGQLI